MDDIDQILLNSEILIDSPHHQHDQQIIDFRAMTPNQFDSAMQSIMEMSSLIQNQDKQGQSGVTTHNIMQPQIPVRNVIKYFDCSYRFNFKYSKVLRLQWYQ